METSASDIQTETETRSDRDTRCKRTVYTDRQTDRQTHIHTPDGGARMDSRSFWLPQRKRRASRRGGPTWEDVSAEAEEEATEE